MNRMEEKEIKLKRVKSNKGCKDCVGNKSDDYCLYISGLASEQGLSGCVGSYVYQEDK